MVGKELFLFVNNEQELKQLSGLTTVRNSFRSGIQLEIEIACRRAVSLENLHVGLSEISWCDNSWVPQNHLATNRKWTSYGSNTLSADQTRSPVDTSKFDGWNCGQKRDFEPRATEVLGIVTQHGQWRERYGLTRPSTNEM